MNFPSTPESGYSHEFDPNPLYQEIEWNTLDKFLEWQREQPEFSSPESLILELDASSKSLDYSSFETHEQFEHSINLESRVAWTQLSSGIMSPSSSLSPPHSMPGDFTLFAEDSSQPRSTPSSTPPSGPQIPKIGRPRATPTSESDSGGKAPTQARRRNQNREAQRAFRARQRQYIDQIASENKALVAKNQELEIRCEMLAKAYERVLGGNTKMGGIGIGNESVRAPVQNGNLENRVGDSPTAAFGMPWNLVSLNFKRQGQ